MFVNLESDQFFKQIVQRKVLYGRINRKMLFSRNDKRKEYDAVKKM